jgi:hypothetical protein
VARVVRLRHTAIVLMIASAAGGLGAGDAVARPPGEGAPAHVAQLPPLTTTCVGKRPGRRWHPCLKFTSRAFGETWLRWGFQDPSNPRRGFGWRHIVASHPELKPWRKATERAIAYVTYYGRVTGGSGTTQVWEGKDTRGKGWRVVLSGRVDRADPYQQRVGVVTAFRIRLR